MKTFSTSGTGSQQTLSEIETDKIPVYDSVEDVTADLANLSVGQIGTTKDTGSELSAPVDTVQSGNMHAVTSNAVYKNCVEVETITGNTDVGGGTYTIKRVGKVVTLDITGMSVPSSEAYNHTALTLPDRLIPKVSMTIAGYNGGGSMYYSAMLGFRIWNDTDNVQLKGAVQFYPYSDLDVYLPQLHAVWIID